MKQLIDHLRNNWIPYFFETLVVIIGILAAFSLNNWSESLQSSKIEKELLNGLRTELENNRTQLSVIMFNRHEGLSACKKLLEMFYTGSPAGSESSIDTLSYLVRKISSWTFNPRLGQLNSIIYSGKLSYIRNQPLVNMISEFEDRCADSNDEIINAGKVQANRLTTHTIKYIPFHSRFQYDGSYPPSKFSSDYEGFLNDREIESTLIEIANWGQNGIAEEQQLMEMIDSMLVIINQELESGQTGQKNSH